MKIRLNEESAEELEGELVTVDLRHSGGRGTGMEQDYDEEKVKDNKERDNCIRVQLTIIAGYCSQRIADR